MRALTIGVVCVGLALASAACGSSSKGNPDAPPGPGIDAGVDGAPGGPDASCFTNPHTHYEIINGCTTVDSVDKHAVLPGLLPDGTLPPLP